MESGEAQIGYKSAEIAFRIGSAVRDMREDRGWSQAELARRAGMTQSAVARLEAAGTIPTLPVVERVCAALDADVDVQITPRTGRGPSRTVAANC
jgi:transcriptional regulator with XRE-family HTH domain